MGIEIQLPPPAPGKVRQGARHGRGANRLVRSRRAAAGRAPPRLHLRGSCRAGRYGERYERVGGSAGRGALRPLAPVPQGGSVGGCGERVHGLGARSSALWG
eukprot:TRINITY_DN16216_c0_g1_i2.p3 TRINITY_DN16216_c0_g1~~TRINITY_DN16216_c0_g1_i2.p3  ORF type:complete len:102 (-),score=3.29 TRINITY_DN16216_c0_g1_i2:45-350(-)